MRARKTCPRCGSPNIDQAHNYDIRAMKYQYTIICYDCGYATEPSTNAGEAWEEWKRKEEKKA